MPAARFGPDLTHLAQPHAPSPREPLPLNRGTLAAWIADPQGVKPGANMPHDQARPPTTSIAWSPIWWGSNDARGADRRHVTTDRGPRDTGQPLEELHARLRRTWGSPGGLWGWLTTVDHKVIGRRYIVTAFVFLLLGGACRGGDARCSWRGRKRG